MDNKKEILQRGARGKRSGKRVGPENPEKNAVTQKKQEAPPIAPPTVAAVEKSPAEKEREEKIGAIVAAEFDDFAKNDLDVKFQRLFSGKSSTPAEIEEVRERFFRERENIIAEISQKNADEINSGAKTFDPEALKHRIHVGIWGKLLNFARWEKGDLFGPTVNPMDGTEDTIDTRSIAMHIIAKIDSSDQLSHNDVGKEIKTEKGREARIKELARRLIKDFTVHGSTKDGKFESYSDLDGRTCLFLFEKAGFTVKKVEYVEKGETTKRGSSVVMDTSGKHGYVIEELGKILVIDHHDPEKSGRDSSGTKFVFEGLRNFGFFDELPEKEKIALESYVNFVTKEDNKDFTDAETINIYNNFTQNLAGLKRYLRDEELYKVFQEQMLKKGKNFDPFEALDPQYLETLTLHDGDKELPYAEADPKKKKDCIKYKLETSKRLSKEGVDGLVKDGFVVETGDCFGKVLIDIGRDDETGPKNRVGMAYDAARGEGFGAYVVWCLQRGHIEIKTANPIGFSLDQGANVRGHYWLKKDSEETLVTLRQVLAELTGDPNFRIPPEMEAAIKKDREKREGIRKKNREEGNIKGKKEKIEFKLSEEQENSIIKVLNHTEIHREKFLALLEEEGKENEYSEEDRINYFKSLIFNLYEEFLSGKFGFAEKGMERERALDYMQEKFFERINGK